MTIAPSRRHAQAVWSDSRLLYALEEVVENELNRHLKVAKDWMPHEYVPWSDGPELRRVVEDGEAWAARAVQGHRHRPDRAGREPAHRGQPAQLPPRDRHPLRPRRRLGHLGAPVDRGGGPARHRDARLPARPRRAVDPVELERFRMAHMSEGFESDNRHSDAALGGLRGLPGAGHPRSRTATPATSPATRSATGCWPGSPPTRTCTWSSTATCSGAAFELAPDQTMRAVRDVVVDFRMPGHGIPASSGPPRRWRSAASTTCASTTTTYSSPCCASSRSWRSTGSARRGCKAQEELGPVHGRPGRPRPTQVRRAPGGATGPPGGPCRKGLLTEEAAASQ